MYFAAAIRGDRLGADYVSGMIDFIKSHDITILSEHVAAPDPVAAFAKRVGIQEQALTAEAIERQDIAWLDEATHVIAEISGASTGTGREIEYARTKGEFGKRPAKVLCIYLQNHEYVASPMIRGMTLDRYPNVSVSSYVGLAHARILIREFLDLREADMPL